MQADRTKAFRHLYGPHTGSAQAGAKVTIWLSDSLSESQKFWKGSFCG